MIGSLSLEAPSLPDWAKRQNDLAYLRLLGIRIQDVRPGWAKIGCTVRPELVHYGAMMNGGVTATLCDLAVVFALWADPAVESPMPTIQMSVSYLNAAQEGEQVQAQARILRRGKRVGVGEVEVTAGEDGRLIAKGVVTCSIRLKG